MVRTGWVFSGRHGRASLGFIGCGKVWQVRWGGVRQVGSGLIESGSEGYGTVRYGRRGWFGAIWLGPVGFFPAG